MRPGLPLRVFAAIAMGASVLCTAQAKDRHMGGAAHDGIFAVHTTTRHGLCGERQLRIAISNGKVTSAGHRLVKVHGRISNNGAVNLTFRLFHHVATARGKLRKAHGSGTWTLPTMQCNGPWRAVRQS